MHFEFDAHKQAINLHKHGNDLKDAAQVFLDSQRLDVSDHRKNYDEERRLTVGLAYDRVWVVVYTQRADVIRLISARKANEREQKRYYALRA